MFKKSDSVQLTIGGPLMVVLEVMLDNDAYHYRCQWNESGVTHKGVFPEHKLSAFDWYNPK